MGVKRVSVLETKSDKTKTCTLNMGVVNSVLNPSYSNSNQRQISLCNISALSVRVFLRIKHMVTQHEFPW